MWFSMNLINSGHSMTRKKPYFDNLDTMRFAAAFAVFIFHAGRDVFEFFQGCGVFENFIWLTKITDKGALGVNFFFVLSGFLITYLMLWEVQTAGRFSYAKFLLRRTLRIWPLYFLIVLLGFVVFPALFPDFQTSHHPVNYLLFLANFDEIQFGATDGVNFLTSPWSIAVEEQFYLVWGLLGWIILKMSPTKTTLLKYSFFFLLTFALLFRIENFEDDRRLYYHTLSVMPDLLLGCLLALVWYENEALFALLKHVKPITIVGIYILGFAMLLLKNLIFVGPWVVAERFAVALFFAFIIADQIIHRRQFPIQTANVWFSYLGKISYGIYMYHLVVMYLLNTYWLDTININQTTPISAAIYALIYVLLSWLLTVILAAMSYRFFEKPFLRLKERF